MDTVEIFSGCGGLAFGLSGAGLKPVAMVEANVAAHRTLEANKMAGTHFAQTWPIRCSDVRAIDWRGYEGRVPVVAGGPPCQPFSQAGKALGEHDKRDMWPEAVRAVREIRPKGFLFENVRGLLRPVFEDYVLNLMETLAAIDPINGYRVGRIMVDAADYGAPQRRQRVIIAGLRGDVASAVEFPKATHSRDRLLWDQWVSGEYWDEHGLAVPDHNHIMLPDRGRVEKLRRTGKVPESARWRTVRDALVGLGDPNGVNHHDFQPGARVYPGHTGSRWDQPAKALKAGTHGVPGGENMLRLENGSVRYFTVREMARLQGFPDGYLFPGNRTANTRQLGNAVPVQLAEAFGLWMKSTLEAANDVPAERDRRPSRPPVYEGAFAAAAE